MVLEEWVEILFIHHFLRNIRGKPHACAHRLSISIFSPKNKQTPKNAKHPPKTKRKNTAKCGRGIDKRDFEQIFLNNFIISHKYWSEKTHTRLSPVV